MMELQQLVIQVPMIHGFYLTGIVILDNIIKVLILQMIIMVIIFLMLELILYKDVLILTVNIGE